MLELPTIVFTPWQHWHGRAKLADAWDVPTTFDFGGLYMLGRFSPNSALPAGPAKPEHAEVVYIGKSQRLTGRTQYHPKAQRYVVKFADPSVAELFIATCDFGHGWRQTDFANGRPLSSVKRAYLALAEREAIWRHALVNKRTPELNLD